jgi:hypothetical protein
MKKKKQNGGQPVGRRLRKAVDGPEIEKRYATTPTAELARETGLTVKQIDNYVYRENPKRWGQKDAATLSQINSENGRKGGRPRKKDGVPRKKTD